MSERRYQPLAGRFERAIEERVDVERELSSAERRRNALTPRRIARTGIWLTITAISLYLVAPSLLDTLGSWQQIRRFQPLWLLVMAVSQGLALACIWVLQSLALRPVPIAPVITSQLAGNALAKIAPGGGALGAALQYRMLVAVGVAREKAVGGLTVVNLLTFTMVLALPVLAIPTLLRGGVDTDLVEVTALGIAVFVVMAAVGALLMTNDRALRWVGRLTQRLVNKLRRRGLPPHTTVPDRLVRERDRILGTFGPRWKLALAATVGRWMFDFGTLLAALAAVHATPRPFLVLLAFCAAQVLAQIPLTPGGLGFVEAGLTGMLSLAGVGPGDAVLATFAYRLFSYWLPLPLGLIAALAHRRVVATMTETRARALRGRPGPDGPSSLPQ